MFGYIEELYEFNRVFCEELGTVVSHWEESERIWETMTEGEPLSIGKLFLDHVSYMNIEAK
jgi:hypothetical protein